MLRWMFVWRGKKSTYRHHFDRTRSCRGGTARHMAIDVPSPLCLAQGRPTLHAAHICSHSLPCNTRLFAPVADHYHHGICRLDRYRVHRISLPRTDWHAMEQQEKKTKMLFNAKIYWKTHSTFYWLIYFVQQLLILGLTFCIVVRCFITKRPSNSSKNPENSQKILNFVWSGYLYFKLKEQFTCL